jgi:hypothetical protein
MAMRCSHVALLACCLGLTSARARAQDAEVPIALQVDLLARLLWYERGLQQSLSKQIIVLVVERRGDPDSKHAAAQLAAQLDRVKELGGKVISHTRVSYESAEQISRIIDQRRPYLIYLSKGLGGAAKELARLLQGRALLTVGTSGSDPLQGAVLGFELASSKPRIVFNLKQARAQKLNFSAQVLRVVRVLP